MCPAKVGWHAINNVLKPRETKQWSEAKNEMAAQTFKQSQTQLMRLGERLRDALSPAE